MGILDLHFSPHYPGLFAVASSAGCITLYHTTDIEDGDPHSCRIQHVFTYQLFPVSTLVLSLAWHQYKGVMAVTLSTGKVAVVEFLDDFKVGRVITEELNPHSDLEAWTVAWSNISSTEKGLNWQAIYSGGDDGQLRCTKFPNFNSLRDDSDYLVDSSPGGRRGISGHQAGVTAILPLPLRTAAGEDILLTGSYDDYVRVVAAFDHRSKMLNKRPKVLAEVNLGGGVWRLKFLRNYSRKLETCIATSSIESGDTSPADQKSSHETAHDQDRADVTYRVLACCMHAGSRILEVTGNKYGDWTITVLARFTEHESMNYGSDVQPILHPGMSVAEELDDSNALVVSTSFYDKLLCVWRFGKGHQSDDAIASETSVGTEHGEDFTTPLSVAVNSKEEAVTPTIAPVSTELLEDISTPTTAPVTAKLAEDAATPSSAPVTTRRGRSGSRKRKGSTTCMTGTFTSPSSTTVSTDHAEHVSAPSAKPGSTKCGGSGTRKAKDNTTDSVRDNMENVTTFSSKTADTNSIEYVSTPSAPPANTRRGRSGSRKANGNTTGNVKGNTENVTPLSSTTTGTNHTEHVPIPSTLANTKRGRSGSRKPKEGTTVGDKENIDDVIPTPNAGTEGEAPTRRLSVRLRERK
jgi:diphthamide biosynthesis protein 7